MKAVEYSENIKKLISNLSNQTRISEIAVKELEGLMKARIFNDGLDSNNNKIGNYSTTESYFGPSQFFKKKPLKSIKFDNGYKGFREYLGRQTAYVDLMLSGSLMLSLTTYKTGSQYVLAIRDNPNDSVSEALKAEGNEDRFNTTIFEPSESEKKAVKKAIETQIDIIFKKFL